MPHRPNFLVICTDHWSGELLGAEGHSHIATPTLDRLCELGTRFTDAYSTTPTCIPARRALMTGTSARTHGDRVFSERLPMPDGMTTLPQAFSAAGYQTFAVGKLHAYPQRSRIGFDEVILDEEGRHQFGLVRDDYEIHLSDAGFTGEEFAHGMGSNDYTVRSWHLDERYHRTYWTTKQMCRTIQRRDPSKPGFWYCSYSAPHPPITPPSEYHEMYRHTGVDEPYIGEWAKNFDDMPYALKTRGSAWRTVDTPEKVTAARMGFYAQCTYVDHQIRLLIGTLREEGLLEDTWLVFTADHGDMLGNHRQWAKPPMHDASVRVPLIVVPPSSHASDVSGSSRGADEVGSVRVDTRLAALRDIMPTLLDAADLEIPATVEGHSLLSDHRRNHIYCEHFEDERALRMVRDDRYKLIWYPVGNRFQLFDMQEDRREMYDLCESPKHADTLSSLKGILRDELYGVDMAWVDGDEFVGLPDRPHDISFDTGLVGQRGWRL